MKTKLILFALLISFAAAFAQDKAKLQKADESGFIEVDKLPALKTQLKPHYPEIARLAGIEGIVYLKILVDENGNVEKAKVEQGAKDMLDNSALEAAKKAKFSPAMVNDKPVKVWVILPVAFKLAVEKKDEDVSKQVQPGENEDPGINEFVKVEKLPEIVEASKPDYPEAAKKAGIEGKVFVKALIDRDGNPKKAIVIKSDNEIFNQPAVNAAMKSKFSRAINEGKPIAVWVVLPYKFILDNKKESVDTVPPLPDLTWLITSDKPEYPPFALERKLEGIVAFKVLFNKKDMSIAKIDLIKGADEILNKEALAYVKKEIKTILEFYESTRQKYLKQHPEETPGGEIKDAAIIRIDYKIEE